MTELVGEDTCELPDVQTGDDRKPYGQHQVVGEQSQHAAIKGS